MVRGRMVDDRVGGGISSTIAGRRTRGENERDDRQKLRIGVLGLGHWYSCYGLARALAGYPRAELVAAAWPDAAQREEFARAFAIEATPTTTRFSRRTDIDIVHIATPVAEIPACTVRRPRPASTSSSGSRWP